MRWLAALAFGALLAGCGGGSGGSVAPTPDEPFVWTDDRGIQAFGAASTLEMGFHGTSSYLRRDGRMIAQAGIFKPDLAYIGSSGTPVAGQTTQWVRYACGATATSPRRPSICQSSCVLPGTLTDASRSKPRRLEKAGWCFSAATACARVIAPRRTPSI